jgi:membrane glycosyltransferase
MRHCALARLPGRGALSGEILSHDFVEAALMRRAGWSVWIAYDLPGSYEQVPPNLIDELQRDRRWCQGNLMNFRLFFMRGLHPTHRAMFAIGVMAYASAPLWFASLLLSTALLAVHALGEPQYFNQPYQLFPTWPEWRPGWALLLFGTTAFLLFLPKLLAVLVAGAKDARRYGGWLRLLGSMLLEWLSSALLAPIRMLFHTQFVLSTLASGWVRIFQLKWKSPPREDAETSWGEALRRHGLHTLIGSAWAAGVYWLDPSYLWWLLPVVGALILSIPLSVVSSRVSLGRRLRRARLLMIPEESRPPREMRGTRSHLRRAQSLSALPDFVAAVVHPAVNALACASGVARPPCSARRAGDALVRKALVEGPQALSGEQKAALLADSLALSRLHFLVWSSDDAHATWRGEPADGSVPVSPLQPCLVPA